MPTENTTRPPAQASLFVFVQFLNVKKTIFSCQGNNFKLCNYGFGWAHCNYCSQKQPVWSSPPLSHTLFTVPEKSIEQPKIIFQLLIQGVRMCSQRYYINHKCVLNPIKLLKSIEQPKIICLPTSDLRRFRVLECFLNPIIV